MSKHLHLRPFDKLFVKDGRPLSLEDDSAASGLFPPPPSVYFGALRSSVLAKADNPPKAVGTDADPAKTGMRIVGSAFAKTEGEDTKLYFPAPNDLVREKGNELGFAERLRLTTESATLTSNPLSGALQPASAAGKVEGVGSFITSEGLKAYLAGNTVLASDWLKADELYGPEAKLGIGLNYESGTTEDGLLYTMSMQRLCKGVRLSIAVEGLHETPSMLRLGAEARGVEVELAAAATTWPKAAAESFAAGSTFSLYLATPAVFVQGWIPDFIKEQSKVGELGGAKVELIAASLGRYLPLGGWDIVARRPKPMRKAVPAGSVYHFKVISGELDASKVHGQPLKSNYPHSGRAGGDQVTYQQQGFGIAYVGVGPATL